MKKDRHLDMLTSFKRNQRMSRWTDTEASANDRIRVIKKGMDSGSEQVVPGLFFLFQSFPEVLQM
jgi:hypothetical protein